MRTFDHERERLELARRLRAVRPDSARRWGTLTAHQMICHLADSFRMALGDKAVSDMRLPLPRPAVKVIALYLPIRWRAGILTSPEIDQRCDGTRPIDFAADVAAVETLMRAVATRDAGVHWPTHPAFGPMSRRDWMRWAYLHTDHHLRQFGV